MAVIPSNKLQEFNPDEEILEQIQKLEACLHNF
jgi:hypothetical protein